MKYQVNRVSDTCCAIKNELDLDVRFFANKEVFVERDAFEELFEFLDVERAARDINAAEKEGKLSFFGEAASIERVVLTPDFHKGSGVPIGTVVAARNFVMPKAIGNDICCGMRLLITDLPAEKLDGHWGELQKKLRALFFQGQRDIPMSPRQREAVLRNGLPGLHETIDDNLNRGIYRHYDVKAQGDDLNRIHSNGGFKTRRLFGFEKFINSSGNIDGRDPQIGSVGGGNHFVEVQRIDEIICGETARRLGITRGNIAIMVHSGSVGLGHVIGGHFMDRAKEIFPKGIKHPTNEFFMLPMQGPLKGEGEFYLDSMYNAANFAFANRLFLGLMAVKAIQDTIKSDVSSKLIYDAPHNLIFEKDGICLHRKGATPAEAADKDDEWMGRPVIIPGSMGSASYLLTGMGNKEALESACHGAGRTMARGTASHVDDKVFDEETKNLRIVTSIDPKNPQLQSRRDILEKYKSRVKEEAPYAYKPIAPVIDSIRDASIARVVAKLFPLCTVKG